MRKNLGDHACPPIKRWWNSVNTQIHNWMGLGWYYAIDRFWYSWSDHVTHEVITRNWLCWRRRLFRVCVSMMWLFSFFPSRSFIHYNDYCVSQFDTASNSAAWLFHDSHNSPVHDFYWYLIFAYHPPYLDTEPCIQISMLSAAHVTKLPIND